MARWFKFLCHPSLIFAIFCNIQRCFFFNVQQNEILSSDGTTPKYFRRMKQNRRGTFLVKSNFIQKQLPFLHINFFNFSFYFTFINVCIYIYNSVIVGKINKVHIFSRNIPLQKHAPLCMRPTLYSMSS